ncbi:MAG: bifunctional DNA primase/polymerase [Rhodopila sp.]
MSRRRLVVIPVGGEDGKRPLTKWQNRRKPYGPKVVGQVVSEHGSDNIGLLCGVSGVTLVDIDDPALMSQMVARYGETPLITETPSGGMHLWYRHGGEPCGNLRTSEGLPVDIKAKGGFVVIPPSVRTSGPHAGKPYQFLRGSWDDLPRLPTMKSDGIAPERRQRNMGAHIPRNTGAHIPQGTRNNTLFRELMRQVKGCDTFDDLLDLASHINAECETSLGDNEVLRTAKQVWKYETSGGNWFGREPEVHVKVSDLHILYENPDALALHIKLMEEHGGQRSVFTLAPKAMASAETIPGWRDCRRYRRARDWLIERGFLIMEHKGGAGIGDPSRFRFGSPKTKKGTVCAPNTNKHPRLRPLHPGETYSMQPKSFSAVDRADEQEALMVARKRFDVAARRSALMGAAIGKRLHAAGISAEAFANVFGVPVSQVHRVLQGELDGKIPVSLQVALEYVERHGAELCRRPELPDMGRNRRGYRLFDVIGWDIYRRLQAIGWSIPDLARFVGMLSAPFAISSRGGETAPSRCCLNA